MSFSAISSVLRKTLQNRDGLQQQVTAALICDEFDKIIQNHFGDKIKNKAKALYFKNNILTIACLSSVMAQEIKLNEKKILDKINKKFSGRVERIRYLV